MKKNKFLISVMILTATMTAVTGCGIKTDTPIVGKIAALNSDEVFEVGELVCPKEEYMILFMNNQNLYKKNFGGKIDWNAAAAENKTLQDVVKEQTKEELSVIYSLADWAQKNHIELSAQEQSAISESAKEYYNGMTDEERNYTNSTMKDVQNLYTKMLFADKEKTAVSEDAGSDISDEQARVIKIQYIHMRSDKQSEKKIRSTFKKVSSVVNGGYQDFVREAKQYSLDATLELTLKKNEADQKFEQEAFQLNDGEISSMIQDGSDYYLVYCVSSYLEEETKNNKSAMIEAAKQRLLNQKYNEYLSSVNSDFNTAAWKKSDVATDSNIRTTNLIDIYEKAKQPGM